MSALSKIRAAGFDVSLEGDACSICPASALTPNQREFLKSHRAEIIKELRMEPVELSASDRQKLLTYLQAIGETDQACIDDYLKECGKDAANLASELKQVDDFLQIKTGDYSGLVQCLCCRHLSGDTCQLHLWRVVVDKRRRCDDFESLQKPSVSELITCKTCSHFQSVNDHGAGAGTCSVGVQSFDACWWADTIHDCEKYLIKAEV